MSSLIPTPRIDKNGVTVIRHMKPDVSGASSVSLPAVVLPAAAPAGPTNEDIRRILDPDSAVHGRFEEPLNLLREENSKTIPLIGDLLTTGNDDGKRLVAEIFRTSLCVIRDIHEYSDDENDWRADAAEWLSPELEGKLVRAWVIGNISAQKGLAINDAAFREMDRTARHTHDSHELRTIKPQQTTSKVYWRGIIALAKSGVRMMDDHRDTSRFIQWAGEHEDIQPVITLAAQRNTLDVETLEGILADQNPSSPVRDGVL